MFKYKKSSHNAELGIVLSRTETELSKLAQVNDLSSELFNLGLLTVFFPKGKYINLRLHFIIEMRECAVGVVLLPASFVQRQIKHFLEFLSRHEDVCVEERVTAMLSYELFHSAHCCHSIVPGRYTIDIKTSKVLQSKASAVGARDFSYTSSILCLRS